MKIFLWIVGIYSLLLAYGMLTSGNDLFFLINAGIGIAAIVFATRKDRSENT